MGILFSWSKLSTIRTLLLVESRSSTLNWKEILQEFLLDYYLMIWASSRMPVPLKNTDTLEAVIAEGLNNSVSIIVIKIIVH